MAFGKSCLLAKEMTEKGGQERHRENMREKGEEKRRKRGQRKQKRKEKRANLHGLQDRGALC
jgi:hypothetical protein